MPNLSRRDLFWTGAAVSVAGTLLTGEAHAAHRHSKSAALKKAGAPLAAPQVRERLKFDFGWRFHLGHACDKAKDFGFGRNLTHLRQGRHRHRRPPDAISTTAAGRR